MCTEDKDIVLGCSANPNQHKSQNKERAQMGQRDRFDAKASESQTNLSRCTLNCGIAREGRGALERGAGTGAKNSKHIQERLNCGSLSRKRRLHAASAFSLCGEGEGLNSKIVMNKKGWYSHPSTRREGKGEGSG